VLGLLAAVTIWWGAWELHTQQRAALEEQEAPVAPGEQGGRAPGGVLEAAEDYARV
jgi:hypothetical protein